MAPATAPAPAVAPPTTKAPPAARRDEDLPSRARRLLADAGFDPAALRVVGRDWTFTYEVSAATGYDDELAVRWGEIFGVLGWHSDDTVTIVNTIAGEPIVRVRATSSDIRDFARELISDATFLSRLEITALGDVPSSAAVDGRDDAGTTLLGHPRPALEPGFAELAAVTDGSLRAVLAVQDDDLPLYQPLPARFAVDQGGAPLSLAGADFTLRVLSSKTKVGAVRGRARPRDGRVAVDLPPRPFAGSYQIEVAYPLPDGSVARATFRYG
ncbi:MAG: hypothetical protein EP329_04100, partial [Deltaproteobacteria bacterium]